MFYKENATRIQKCTKIRITYVCVGRRYKKFFFFLDKKKVHAGKRKSVKVLNSALISATRFSIFELDLRSVVLFANIRRKNLLHTLRSYKM
jgi:hypothetical protein